jgi:hypothetical protein
VKAMLEYDDEELAREEEGIVEEVISKLKAICKLLNDV